MSYKQKLSKMTKDELLEEAIVVASCLRRWRKDSPEHEEASLQFKYLEEHVKTINK